MASAREQGLDILELHSKNIDQEISRLAGSPELVRDIRTAVSAENLVLIPETDIRMGEWKGTGYMVIDPESGTGSYMIHGGIVGKADGGSGIFAATLATLYRIGSGVLALSGTFGAIVALSTMTTLTAGIYVCIALLLVIGFFTFRDIWNSTIQYLDYLKDGDEEELAGMIGDALWAGLFDLVTFAGGRVLKKLADSMDLKVKDCTQWPVRGKYSVPDIGFRSFDDLKDYIGTPGEGNAWHHIVEQSQINNSGFSVNQVHNVNNIIALPNGKGSIHAKVSGFYSSKPDFTNGLTVRQWLTGKSFEEQFNYGIKVLERYGEVVETEIGWKFIPFNE